MKVSEQTVLVRSLKNPLVTRKMTVNSLRLNSAYWESVEIIPNKHVEKIDIDIVKPEGFYNVVAVVPVFGRMPLVKQTVKRLILKNNIERVVCVCSTEQDYKYLLDLSKGNCGISPIQHKNFPLGAKWNAGFVEAQKYNPDACLFVGSSDWVSDNWVSTLLPLIKDYDMIGMAGCRLLDISKGGMKALEWHGYMGDREDESIGIGRLISARILDRIGWKPFFDHKDGSLDYAMQLKVKKAGGKCAIIHHPELISMAISTDKWENKHKYKDHETGVLRRNSLPIKDLKGFLTANFPEAYEIFK